MPYPKTDETMILSAARHIGVKLGTIPEALFLEVLGEDATPEARGEFYEVAA